MPTPPQWTHLVPRPSLVRRKMSRIGSRSNPHKKNCPQWTQSHSNKILRIHNNNSPKNCRSQYSNSNSNSNSNKGENRERDSHKSREKDRPHNHGTRTISAR